jgi:hypothetical protein
MPLDGVWRGSEVPAFWSIRADLRQGIETLRKAAERLAVIAQILIYASRRRAYAPA